MANKKMTVVGVAMPANAKEILVLDAKRHKRAQGRHLLECWLRQLEPAERAIAKGGIGIAQTPRKDALEAKIDPHMCKECGASHPNIPGPGPWHEEKCSQWHRRAMWG